MSAISVTVLGTPPLGDMCVRVSAETPISTVLETYCAKHGRLKLNSLEFRTNSKPVPTQCFVGQLGAKNTALISATLTKITIVVQCGHGEDTEKHRFLLKQTASLRKLKAAFCARIRIQPSAVRLHFGRAEISEFAERKEGSEFAVEMTPLEAGIGDGDVVVATFLSVDAVSKLIGYRFQNRELFGMQMSDATQVLKLAESGRVYLTLALKYFATAVGTYATNAMQRFCALQRTVLNERLLAAVFVRMRLADAMQCNAADTRHCAQVFAALIGAVFQDSGFKMPAVYSVVANCKLPMFSLVQLTESPPSALCATDMLFMCELCVHMQMWQGSNSTLSIPSALLTPRIAQCLAQVTGARKY